MRGCCEIGKKKEMGSLFEEKKLNVFGLSEPNLIGKGEINFEEVRVFKSGVGRKGRQREGVTVLSNCWFF